METDTQPGAVDTPLANVHPFEQVIDQSSSHEIIDWGGAELEAAYLKAMSALEASESEIPDGPIFSGAAPVGANEIQSDNSQQSTGEHFTKGSPAKSRASDGTGSSSSAADLLLDQRSIDPMKLNPANLSPVERPPTPQQIIEACLFVGGAALTASRLAGVLRGEFDSEFVDREIDQLNRLYSAENRPYEIRLGEGGYRLALREEYERIRHKTYGLGPKEVRLSQDALEVLAVVAYQQPIKQSAVEELGKPGCGAVLKQLVRRELLAIERDPAHPRDVSYKTTARFLSLFGIQNLDELPRNEQVSYK